MYQIITTDKQNEIVVQNLKGNTDFPKALTLFAGMLRELPQVLKLNSASLWYVEKVRNSVEKRYCILDIEQKFDNFKCPDIYATNYTLPINIKL